MPIVTVRGRELEIPQREWDKECFNYFFRDIVGHAHISEQAIRGLLEILVEDDRMWPVLRDRYHDYAEEAVKRAWLEEGDNAIL